MKILISKVSRVVLIKLLAYHEGFERGVSRTGWLGNTNTVKQESQLGVQLTGVPTSKDFRDKGSWNKNYVIVRGGYCTVHGIIEVQRICED